jgi:hypothetical protein
VDYGASFAINSVTVSKVSVVYGASFATNSVTVSKVSVVYGASFAINSVTVSKVSVVYGASFVSDDFENVQLVAKQSARQSVCLSNYMCVRLSHSESGFFTSTPAFIPSQKYHTNMSQILHQCFYTYDDFKS